MAEKDRVVILKNGKEINVNQGVVKTLIEGIGNHPDGYEAFIDENGKFFLMIKLNEIACIK